MSGPPGQSTSPHGNWSIIGFVDSDALLAKESTVARVPVKDLRKVGSLDTNHVLEEVSKAGYLSPQKFNMPDHLATIYGITVAEARRLLQDHNYQIVVRSISERDTITAQIAKVING